MLEYLQGCDGVNLVEFLGSIIWVFCYPGGPEA